MNRPKSSMPRPAEMASAPEPPRLHLPRTERAGATLQLDTDAFLMSARGMADVGRAVAATGSALSELRVRQQEAIGIHQEGQADQFMEEAEEAIAADVKGQPDEAKWAGIVDGHVARVRERIGGLRLAGATAEVVGDKVKRWALHRTQQTVIASAGHSFTRAREAIDKKLLGAQQRGDRAAFENTLAGAVQKGYFSEAAAQSRNQEFEEEGRRRERRFSRELQRAEAGRDPDAFLKQYGDSTKPGIDSGALQLARRTQRGRLAAAVSQLEAALEDDDESGAADMARTARMDSTLLRRLQESVARRRRPAAAAAPAVPPAEEASRLLSEITDLDPDETPADRYVDLHVRVQELPAELREPVRRRLESVWTGMAGGAAAAAGDTSLQGRAEAMLHKELQRGTFGRYLTSAALRDAAGNEVTDVRGQPWQYSERDEARYTQALQAKARAGAAMARWAAQNPRADDAALQKELYALLSAQARVRLVDSLMVRPAPADSGAPPVPPEPAPVLSVRKEPATAAAPGTRPLPETGHFRRITRSALAGLVHAGRSREVYDPVKGNLVRKGPGALRPGDLILEL